MFPIGARVKTTRIGSGEYGTVCDLLDELVGVDHDEPMGGHDCQGHCQDGFGWYYNKGNIKLIDLGGITDFDESEMPLSFLFE